MIRVLFYLRTLAIFLNYKWKCFRYHLCPFTLLVNLRYISLITEILFLLTIVTAFAVPRYQWSEQHIDLVRQTLDHAEQRELPILLILTGVNAVKVICDADHTLSWCRSRRINDLLDSASCTANFLLPVFVFQGHAIYLRGLRFHFH